jgi:UDP-N-acetylglucosamine/UDP-N-acetylgalactosamine 4-epimerase
VSTLISSHYRSVRQQLTADPKVWLVTGVAGFIGSNLLEDLLGLGQTVIGLDNFATGHSHNIDEALGRKDSPGFRLIEGDIRDLATCRSACEGVDYVLHHAALGSVPWSIEDPLETNSVNVNGFLNILLAAREAGVKRVVYASSSAVYGDIADYPQVEERVGRALSPYAASKATNETYAQSFQASYGLQTIGLRYFNVFGRRQDPAGAYAAVIPRWIDGLLHGTPCQIFGDGETTRDFCYIANVVQANLLAALAEEPATCQSYNVACGHAISLNELFALIRDQLAVADPIMANSKPRYEPYRAGDIRFSCAAIEKARQMLSFVPTHGVAEGISEAFQWYAKAARERAPAGASTATTTDRHARRPSSAKRDSRDSSHALLAAS